MDIHGGGRLPSVQYLLNNLEKQARLQALALAKNILRQLLTFSLTALCCDMLTKTLQIAPHRNRTGILSYGIF
jgi:hypothetical protein